jgi:hypothetical protein
MQELPEGIQQELLSQNPVAQVVPLVQCPPVSVIGGGSPGFCLQYILPWLQFSLGVSFPNQSQHIP